MFKIKTYDKISSAGMGLFSHDNFEVGSEISNPDALILRSFKLNEEHLTDRVKAIARAGAGVNNIPVQTCTEKGIVVFNTPGANANAVKELVIAGMLLASRDIHGGIGYVGSIASQGADIPSLVEKNKSQFKGFEITGKKLGVIGLGAIGLMVANAAVALGMEVEGYDPFISVDKAWILSSEVKPASSLESLLSSCDFVSIHVPFSENTKHIIDAGRLKQMKKGITVLNFSRDELIDEPALIRALESGQIHRYVTDFPNPTIVGIPGVIAIPHLGASTEEAEDNCAVMAVRQLTDYLEHGHIVNSVNFPNCRLERSGESRMVIGNRNIPNVISKITTIMAEENLNITEMVNKSRGDLAYNIVDYNGKATESLREKILGIEGVLRARLLDN